MTLDRIELMEEYEDLQPGYHMNKVIWWLFYPIHGGNA
jgi:predicted DNA-binding protein (MmcQ/YjbR family)